MSWRDSINDLPREQRDLVLGGALSQRFIRMPLDLSHPAFIGALYGFLISSALILPMGQFSEWNLEDWWKTFLVNTLFLVTISSLCGLISRISVGISKRNPLAPPRKLLYPMPFIGLAWLTLEMTEIVDFWVVGAWLCLLLPGPIYIHMSWAPRWRLLSMLESNTDPFHGNEKPFEKMPQVVDEELEEVVANFGEE
ncbi:MAG: hypothetical protein ACKVHH_06105 [Candidatus Poseidoniales archaeon]|jgi:hypothetical protein